MKQNTKGFTLIELLAVIVILAIIALIATPIILNMINEARKSGAKSSTLGFVDSIEYYAGFSEANNAGGVGVEGYDEDLPAIPANATTVTCTASTSSNVTTFGGADGCAAFFSATTGVVSKAKGKTPDAANIVLDANGKVQAGTWMKFNGYYCSYNGTDVPDNGCSKTQPSA